MKKITLPLALLLCFLVLNPPVASAKDNWISVKSKNFLLIGNASEKQIKQVAGRLEQFREVFTKVFPHMKFNTPVPTTVVVFKSRNAYKVFGPPNSGGYFQGGVDVNYIALSTERYGPPGQDDDGVFNIIFHEYTHLLVKNTFKNAPAWFNEGLAVNYEGSDLAKQTEQVRKAASLLPLSRLERSFAGLDAKQATLAYAQSAVAVHAEGCHRVAPSGEALQAGTNCGSCRAEIRAIIAASGGRESTSRGSIQMVQGTRPDPLQGKVTMPSMRSLPLVVPAAGDG